MCEWPVRIARLLPAYISRSGVGCAASRADRFALEQIWREHRERACDVDHAHHFGRLTKPENRLVAR